MRRKGTRLILGGLAALGLAGAGALAIAFSDGETMEARPASERPTLMLVTTLPIVFPEEFTLDAQGSKALAALESRYKVVPIGTTDARSLGQARLLLMAHPLAQPGEDLVALDEWVREGGQVLVLADPLLEWPSNRALGDKLRPPPSFADTGLLAHWGLKLTAPDETGPQQSSLSGFEILTASPGSLSGECTIRSRGLVARCNVGKGKATVVADADFLNVEGLDGPDQHNLDALLAELAELER
ncbi:MAG TPA: hypothetical protein VJ775_06910 [Sphingomicrobium sp.]|jgi:hypothetical protein|nr:hypothetical protein [Sphingomicrobium sp.]